jgi:hypothetical protein
VDLETELIIAAWLESALESQYGVKVRIDTVNPDVSTTPTYYYQKLISDVRTKFAPNYNNVSIHYAPIIPNNELWLLNTPNCRPFLPNQRKLPNAQDHG